MHVSVWGVTGEGRETLQVQMYTYTFAQICAMSEPFPELSLLS